MLLGTTHYCSWGLEHGGGPLGFGLAQSLPDMLCLHKSVFGRPWELLSMASCLSWHPLSQTGCHLIMSWCTSAHVRQALILLITTWRLPASAPIKHGALQRPADHTTFS